MKFTVFQPTPLPDPSGDPMTWARDLVSVLDENMTKLKNSVNGLGQDATSFTEQYIILPAATALTAGDLCYLDSTGAMDLADASTEATSSSLLAIATQSIASGSEGKFLLKGIHTTTGLSPGQVQFVHTTAGEWTYSKPGSSGEIVRVIGYALGATSLFFDPDKSWVEIT